jgi:hypothetical protein
MGASKRSRKSGMGLSGAGIAGGRRTPRDPARTGRKRALDRVSAMPRVQRPTGGPEARLALFPARRDRDRLRPGCGLGRAHRFDHRS